jgi:hypothetical protein
MFPMYFPIESLYTWWSWWSWWMSQWYIMMDIRWFPNLSVKETQQFGCLNNVFSEKQTMFFVASSAAPPIQSAASVC